MELAQIAMRTAISFAFLLLLTRIIGRKQISELTFFDYVTGISIGTIAGSVSAIPSLALPPALYAMAFWTILTLAAGFAARASIPARKLMESEPVMVIRDGQILEETLRRKKYTVNNLLMQLREQEVFDPSEVAVGIIETDGKLSLQKRAKESRAAGPVAPTYRNKELIIDGVIQFESLSDAGVAPDWLAGELRKQGITDPREVALAMMTPSGTLYVDKARDSLPPGQRRDK